MITYDLKPVVSGDTFPGVRFTLSNQDGPISLEGAVVVLSTNKKRTLSSADGEITTSGNTAEIKPQRINWAPMIYKYSLVITFPDGRRRTYIRGQWQII